MNAISLEEFEAMYSGLAQNGVDAAQYQRLSATVIDLPWATLKAVDPFSEEYKQRVLEIYVRLSGGQKSDYVATRDERSGLNSPANIWMDLPPWSFRDPTFASEFLLAWGHILSLMELGAQPGASVLEYGAGSGQLLLMLARMGVAVHAVDIDPTSVGILRQQASVMDLPLKVEVGEFGGGFGDEKFDCILFFESFHHSLEFLALLPRLRERLKPSGRVVLSGEPVLDTQVPVLPYPWGPRLDALSVFCIRATLESG